MNTVNKIFHMFLCQMIFRSARELWAFYVIAEVALSPTQFASPLTLPEAGDNFKSLLRS